MTPSLPSLFDRLCQPIADGSLPAVFHVPLQQHALSGVETDRILTDAEQELWRRSVMLGYIFQKHSDQFFADSLIPSFISPALAAWLTETVTEKDALPVTRLMALMHKHLAPYDRLYDLKKERSVKRYYRDLVLTLNMMRGFPPVLLPGIALESLAEEASGLPQPETPSFPLSKGLAYVWRYLLPRIPFEPTNSLRRADFLVNFFRLFEAVYLDESLITRQLIDYLNAQRYPAAAPGVYVTNFMMEVFRLAGIAENESWRDPAFAAALVAQFFQEAYPTLLVPGGVADIHDAIAVAAGITPRRQQFNGSTGVAQNYVWRKPEPLPLNPSRGLVNVLGVDDAGGQLEALGRRLFDMAKASLVRSVYVPPRPAGQKQTFQKAAEEKPHGPINLFACAVDRLSDFIMRRGLDYFEGRYNIGYCRWATDRLPQTYKVALHLFDEIWVPSAFEKTLFEKETDRPVHVIPAPINMDAPTPYMNRAMIDLPEDAFVFVTSFDCLDWMSRKNPLAVVKAFQEAFRDNENVVLAVKTRNITRAVPLKEEGHVARMQKAWADDPRIHIFHDDFSDAEMAGFLNLADCYVTLPRCSAFDATLAEAMALGKPVITPGGYGPADYASPATAQLVDTVPCSVVFDAYHFLDKEVGHGWSDPEISSAAAAMRRAYEKQAGVIAAAREGQRVVKSLYSLEACGRRMKQRIDEIRAERGL